MNPTGWCRCCVTTKVISFFGNQTHCPLSGGTVRAKTPVDRLTGRRAEAEKWMDWANQTLSNALAGS